MIDLQSFVGKRVRVYQPVPVTTRKRMTGTLESVTGLRGGVPRIHLTDVTTVHEGGQSITSVRKTMDFGLNWTIEIAE